jgi:hypothetical protein
MAQFSPLDAIVVTADAFIGRSDSPSINTSNVALYHVGLGQELIKKAGAEFDYRVFKALHAFAGLDYTYFSFGSSPVQATGFFEPFSKTTVYNYTAGLRYSFSGWHPMAGYSAN